MLIDVHVSMLIVRWLAHELTNRSMRLLCIDMTRDRLCFITMIAASIMMIHAAWNIQNEDASVVRSHGTQS